MPRRITIRVIPRSSQNTLFGPMPDGSFKVKLTAAPTDGKANDALVDFLSKSWNVPKSSIRIIAGFKNKQKVIEVV